MKRRLRIIHETEYRFTDEVFIEPHYLRFKPRTSPYNQLVNTDLRVFPAPTGMIEQNDPENNLVQFCWFIGMHRSLVIHSESLLVVNDKSPYDFIVFPESYAGLPFQYSPMLEKRLKVALSISTIEDSLIDYGEKIMKKSDQKTIGFINLLTKRIHEDFELITRMEGAPYEGDVTFKLKKGSCRDLSWMQIQLLRHLGIAARFVSGYCFISEDSAHDLHGWVEVYIPGAGWVGYDPSHGAMAGSSHIPVCSSSYYQSTMPVIGSFRGDAASTLSTNLKIEKL